MLHASTRKLIDRLAEMTELGKLDWAEGEGQNVIYSTEGYSVSLMDAPNEVVITSKDGKELERATSEELAATTTEDGKNYATIVAEMTSEAIRIARGTEVAISTLLAGMAEPVVEETPAPEPELDDAPEDAVDETSALSAVAVASVAADQLEEIEETTEPAEATSEAEEEVTKDEPDLSASEPETETEAEPEAEDAAAVLSVDDAADEIATEAPAPDVVEESAAQSDTDGTETESGVTEAVARMADEVNQREETTESSSNNGALGAGGAALGAALMFATRDDEAEEEQAPELETAPEAEPEALEIAAEPDTPADATWETEPEPVVVDIPEGDVEASLEPAIAAEPETIAKSYVPFGLEPEHMTETADVAAEEQSAEIEIDAAPEEVSEPEPTVEEWVSPTYAASSVASAVEEAADVEPDTAAATVSDPEPTPEPVEPETSTPEPAPAAQTYSLSGIGAGFGLGALSAKTEASGIPGPSAGSVSSSEKVVIDATDDVLPEPESHLNVPLAEQVTAAVKSAAPAEAPKSEDAEAEDGDILKPRTRFNPWD